MGKLIVKKCKNLEGNITIHGSKNEALPALAASILSDEPSFFYSVPRLSDTENMLNLLRHLGMSADVDNCCVKITPGNIKTFKACEDYVNKLRASILIAGPMVAKYGKIDISYPGGCTIGGRPIDLHLKGFELLGAKIEQKHGNISITSKKLKGNRIYLDFPSVGATENILMAATLAEGETIIENAATEPEIAALSQCLCNMGARIAGGGTQVIRISGVDRLCGASHTIIPDRIEAGTYMAAVGAVKGRVQINNIICSHLKPVIAKLRETGVEIRELGNSAEVISEQSLKPADIITLPYPGFPTDMQASFSVLLSQIKGTSLITESIFENRFQHLTELKKMGANVKIDGRCAVIEGGRLSGARVKSTDLRAGAALVIAGMCASGETEINDTDHILRGYQDFDRILKALGANIEKESLTAANFTDNNAIP